MGGALHIGGPGGQRVAVALAHQGLGGQVQQQLGLHAPHAFTHRPRVAQVGQGVAGEPLVHARHLEQRRLGAGREREAVHLGAQLLQPQRSASRP
jgi:hypothetical protein